ncbi:hypothetical protein PsYK624_162870 [Phanerochaete sordida]|uniref:Uncharacterized protein n=1 Tax=Phanerochaete sordida TaxID=48140 RepID=A0A9P3GVS2_9APHY|nr:hypothetical protein PsYK624_162870 [Phanerochaete sordida]
MTSSAPCPISVLLPAAEEEVDIPHGAGPLPGYLTCVLIKYRRHTPLATAFVRDAFVGYTPLVASDPQGTRSPASAGCHTSR